VVERFANGVTILQDTVPGLVTAIENGQLDAPETRAILERALEPMLAQNIDTVVLGCTHFPFVIPLIQQIVGPGVKVIDPAPAIARQTLRMLEAHDLLATGKRRAATHYFTSGDRLAFKRSLRQLLNQNRPVEQVSWLDGRITPDHARKNYLRSSR